ncbi:MAG: aminotransferase class V-fold PLP-dependent enzyme [Fodinibius sp.]|nr:aminotransferase class V-fold PLP-dependent enzyme [Fodinibius sp.]
MDIKSLRRQTPGTQHVIHFNNAGASLMPEPVTDAVISYLREESRRGGYETAQKHHTSLENIYPTIGNFINADKDEIAILENATAAWNMAFFAVDFTDGDRILTSMAEYASNFLGYLKLQEKVDVQIDVIPNDASGQTSVDALRKMMAPDVRLVSITHIPTNSGLVNPIEEIGTIANQYPCLYLVDACQSVGQYPVDVQQVGCDMLSATGRKYLRGPRGTGFLYVNRDALPHLSPPFLDLHAAEWTGRSSYQMRDDARRFENWEANYAGILGLKQAVQYAQKLGIENIWNRITTLAHRLRRELSHLPNVTLRDIGETQCGIVTFTVDGENATDIQQALHQKNINVNTSSQSSTLLDMEQRNLREVIRASVHYYNTNEEIEEFTDLLETI